MATKTTTPAKQTLKDSGHEDLALSGAELKAAQKEGAKQDATDAAAESHRFLTDGNLPGEPTNMRWHGYDEIQPWAFYLDGSLDAIKDAVKDGGIPDNKLYGLLALERNGQNRTDYVKYMIDQLDLKKDADKDTDLATVIPGGGPSYTNDTTNVSDLK